MAAEALKPGPGRETRLLVLSHFFEERRGGIERVAAALAHARCLRGFRVTWLAAGRPAGGDAALRREGLASSLALERLLGIPYPLPWPSAWRRIVSEVRCTEIVLAHDALYPTTVIAALAARRLHRPLVIVQHIGEVPYRRALLRGLMRLANALIAARVLRAADRVVFVSRTTAEHFAAVKWRRPPEIVFNGLDPEVFRAAGGAAEVRAARARLGLAPDGRIALFVGRFVEKKGLHALERIARGCQEVTFAFAGEGPLDPVRWGLANVRVWRELEGPSLAELYRASDLLILPSVGEGFPLVVQEALACGLRVLCGTDSAAADPVAQSLLRGLPVAPDDPEATAQRFAAALRSELGVEVSDEERGHRSQFARERYSWERSTDAYERILRELCGGDARIDSARAQRE